MLQCRHSQRHERCSPSGYMQRLLCSHESACGTPGHKILQGIVTWCPHSEACITCNDNRRGRPAKATKKRGRPQGETTNSIITHIRESAAPSVDTRVAATRVKSLEVDPSHLICTVCPFVANAPVTLGCGPIACSKCVIDLLLSGGPETCCPKCNTALNSEHIERCTVVLSELLLNVRVECTKCHLPVHIRELGQHEEACSSPPPMLPRHTAYDVTLEAVINTPLQNPLSPDETVACTRLVKRAMRGGKELVLKTGGQVRPTRIYSTCIMLIDVRTIHMIPKPRV